MPSIPPVKNQTTFGLEIEFFIPAVKLKPDQGSSRSFITNALLNENFMCTRAGNVTNNPSKETFVLGIKNDTSIKSLKPTEMFDEGLELVTSPFFFNEKTAEQIKKLFKILKESGAEVNKTCGFHVHLGLQELRSQIIQTIVERFNRYHKEFYKIVDEERKESLYCSPLTIEEEQIVREAPDPSRITINPRLNRYHSINPMSFRQHGTIEFRLFHATLDEDEVVAWLSFLAGFFSASVAKHPQYDVLRKQNVKTVNEYQEKYDAALRIRNEKMASIALKVSKIRFAFEDALSATSQITYNSSLLYFKALEEEEKRLLQANNKPVVASTLVETGQDLIIKINQLGSLLYNIPEVLRIVNLTKSRVMLVAERLPFSIVDFVRLATLNKSFFSYMETVFEDRGIMALPSPPTLKYPEDNFLNEIDKSVFQVLLEKQMQRRISKTMAQFQEISTSS